MKSVLLSMSGANPGMKKSDKESLKGQMIYYQLIKYRLFDGKSR
jgi:hypothetical protein